MNTLEQKIFRALRQAGGVISFAQFMEMALYEPGLGYYERLSSTPGRRGDFFTNVSVGRLFGDLLGAHLLEKLGRLLEAGVPAERLMLAEAGAHDGRLAKDILDRIRSSSPGLWEKLTYLIIEPGEIRQRWQKETLAAHRERIEWTTSPEALPNAFTGVIFSNELLDAFPVHRLGWDADVRQWFEWGVGWNGQHFTWERMKHELSRELTRSLPSIPPALAEVLPDAFILEASPAATAWWRQAANRLAQGWLMTIDYGLEELEFLDPIRAKGTLRAYREHRLAENVLSDPGQQDLTCHINLSALARAGEAAGLATERVEWQGDFLAKTLVRCAQADSILSPENPGALRQFQTLTHPEFLGRRFKVLIQQKPAPLAAGHRLAGSGIE